MTPQTFFERVEYKYWVDDSQLPGLTRFVKDALVPDLAGGTHDQRNVSLYLDTPDFAFYRHHDAQIADRIKLRLRRYGTNPNPDQPVFLEVKRKVKHVIVKKRTSINGRDVASFLEGNLPKDSSNHKYLEQFAYMQLVSRAEPVVVVACDREAWKAADPLDQARLTIDRNIVYQPWRGEYFNLNRAHDIPINGESEHNRGTTRRSLLELKFCDRAPSWMGELLTRFRLERTSFSKFCCAMRKEFGERYHGSELSLSPLSRPATSSIALNPALSAAY